MKVTQDNVSYFWAGILLGLIFTTFGSLFAFALVFPAGIPVEWFFGFVLVLSLAMAVSVKTKVLGKIIMVRIQIATMLCLLALAALTAIINPEYYQDFLFQDYLFATCLVIGNTLCLCSSLPLLEQRDRRRKTLRGVKKWADQVRLVLAQWQVAGLTPEAIKEMLEDASGLRQKAPKFLQHGESDENIVVYQSLCYAILDIWDWLEKIGGLDPATDDFAERVVWKLPDVVRKAEYVSAYIEEVLL